MAGGVFTDIVIVSHSHVLGRSPKEQTSPCHLVRGFHFGHVVADNCFVEHLDSQIALNLFSPNLLVGKLVRCPNCGKWFIGRRASIDDLRIAEEAAWAQAHGAPQFSEMKEEEKIRKGLDDSKYQGM